MSPLNRRGFMKTLFVTAAGVSCLDPSQAIAASRFDADSGTGSTILEHGDQQLRISSVGKPFSFQNFLRDGNK